jgi:acetyltransferase-like isoleucine patch superfamily enzyme
MFYSIYFKKVGKNVIISPHVYFEVPEKIEIGNNCAFNRDCWVSGGGSLVIHDDVIIGPKVIIHSANHNFSRYGFRDIASKRLLLNKMYG